MYVKGQGKRHGQLCIVMVTGKLLTIVNNSIFADKDLHNTGLEQLQ